MSRRGFFQSAGQIGPTPGMAAGLRFAPAANPWVNQVAGLTPRQTPRPLARPVAATATIAGRPHIGCCGQCAAEHRGG
jgi:hypothetical protein